MFITTNKWLAITLAICFAVVILFLNLAMHFDANGMMMQDCPLPTHGLDCANFVSHFHSFMSSFAMTLVGILIIVFSGLAIVILKDQNSFGLDAYRKFHRFKEHLKNNSFCIKSINSFYAAIFDGKISPLVYA
jgi:hypothetical protein